MQSKPPQQNRVAPNKNEEIRCKHKLHGVLISMDVVEVKCDSRFCGAEKGIVVLHRFSTFTGELLETLLFATPQEIKE
jgi:hypothetical protein